MMNDVASSKKWARASHVGSLYESLTTFNDSENYNATEQTIAWMKCVRVTTEVFATVKSQTSQVVYVHYMSATSCQMK